MELELYQNFFYGECQDNEDPLMLGRIRLNDITDNQQARENASNQFNPNSKNTENGLWSNKDPFVALPLLPYFINQIPKPTERVIIFYYNNNKKTIRDKYYVIAPYSSPTTIFEESATSSTTNQSAGDRNSRIKIPNIKDADNKIPLKSEGVFIDPVDISINGRDTADLVIKKDDILLRAGKHKPFNIPQIPEGNEKRAFLQLSNFKTKKIFSDPQSTIRLQDNQQQVSYIIEYDVINPENTQNAFSGRINFYNIINKNSQLVTTNFLDVDTNLSGLTSLIFYREFQALSIDDLAKLINETLFAFLKNPNNIRTGLVPESTSQFPFYFRPSEKIRKITTVFSDASNVVASANMALLMSKVKLNQTDPTPGYNLVIDAKNSPNIPLKPVKEVFVSEENVPIDTSIGVMSASELYLLTHETTIPGKKEIKLGTDTLYGIDANSQAYSDMNLYTSSVVRGEELLELLQIMVNVLITHVHPYPLMPPSSVTVDGTSMDDLLKTMQEAYTKVLNSKIRIN